MRGPLAWIVVGILITGLDASAAPQEETHRIRGVISGETVPAMLFFIPADVLGNAAPGAVPVGVRLNDRGRFTADLREGHYLVAYHPPCSAGADFRLTQSDPSVVLLLTWEPEGWAGVGGILTLFGGITNGPRESIDPALRPAQAEAHVTTVVDSSGESKTSATTLERPSPLTARNGFFSVSQPKAAPPSPFPSAVPVFAPMSFRFTTQATTSTATFLRPFNWNLSALNSLSVSWRYSTFNSMRYQSPTIWSTQYKYISSAFLDKYRFNVLKSNGRPGGVLVTLWPSCVPR